MNIKQSIKYLRSRGYVISRPLTLYLNSGREVRYSVWTRADGAEVGPWNSGDIKEVAAKMLRREERHIADAIAMATAGEVMR